MNTLFLGATGFLGSALVQEVTDKFPLSCLVREENENLKQSGHTVIRGSIEDIHMLKKISTMGFERLIDCSWIGLPDLSEVNNVKNLRSKLDLYQSLFDGGLRELNSFGSCLEYGSSTGVTAENIKGKNVGDFGLTKLKLLEVVQNYGIRYRWFRPFYLLGSGQHENSLIASAISNLRYGQEFKPKHPNYSYDFIPVQDAATAVVKAIQEPSCAGIINIGTGETQSVNEVVNYVRDYFQMPVSNVEKHEGMAADISKLLRHTNWSPRINISSCITEMIEKSLEST
jgi:nucleoside-diphosphate-sugar epimerase